MKRLLFTLLLLTGCAVSVDVSNVNVALPSVPSEIALDKPINAKLSISGTHQPTEVLYVALQYRDGTRWVTFDKPVEIVLNDEVSVPLTLDPGSYTIRTALWAFRPEPDQEPDKVSIDTSLQVFDNISELALFTDEWQRRTDAKTNVKTTLNDCRKTSENVQECVISFLQDLQDFIWASHNVKDIGSATSFTSNLQPQFSSFLYFHNIVLTKIEASFLAYCQEMKLDKTSLNLCAEKLQTSEIETALNSLKQSHRVLNGLLLKYSYKPFTYGETKGLFG